MDKTFEHYKRVLDDLIAENEFFRFYFQSPYTLMDRDNGLMREDYNCGNHNIEMFFGVTRGCIVDADYDEVVKFNLDTADENACSYASFFNLESFSSSSSRASSNSSSVTGRPRRIDSIKK